MIVLISIPIFIGALDLTVVSAFLPHVIIDLEIPFQTGLDDAAWVVSGYLLAYSISMTFMGRLSDLYGRRKIFLIALVIFGFGSYLVAVSHTWPTTLVLRGYYLVASGRPDVSFVSLYVLIASRMIQAFGAGTMVPVGMALVGDIYPAGKRARMLGLIAAVDTGGWVIGHLYGGIIVRFWDWRLIFWLNIPLCIIAFGLIWYLLKDIEQPLGTGRMDWVGSVLIMLSLAALNIGLGAGADGSSSASLGDQSALPSNAVPLVISALILLGIFIWWQNKVEDPLIDLSLFKIQNFLAASVTNFLLGIGLFIAIANVPLFINSLIAATPEQGAWDSGWLLSALTIPMAMAAVFGGWVTERRGYRMPTVLGLFIAAVGFGVMTSWTANTPYATMIPQLAITGIGMGIAMTPIAAAVVNASPSEHRGTSSALVIIFRLVGMTIGVSGITTFGLRRVDILNARIITDTTNFNEIAEIGRSVVEMVLNETFIVAAVVMLIALLPGFRLKNSLPIAKEGE